MTKGIVVVLSILLAGCSAASESTGDHVTAANHHDVPSLYGIDATATVRAVHHENRRGGAVVIAELELVHATDNFGRPLSGKIAVLFSEAVANNERVDLATIQPGATIHAFVSYVFVDSATHTVIARETPYVAILRS